MPKAPGQNKPHGSTFVLQTGQPKNKKHRKQSKTLQEPIHRSSSTEGWYNTPDASPPSVPSSLSSPHPLPPSFSFPASIPPFDPQDLASLGANVSPSLGATATSPEGGSPLVTSSSSAPNPLLPANPPLQPPLPPSQLLTVPTSNPLEVPLTLTRPPAENPSPLPESQLVTNDLFNRVGIRFHRQYRVVICTSCHQCILPALVAGHMNKSHNLRVSSDDATQVLAHLMSMDAHKDQASVVPPAEKCPPIELLKVISTDYCCTRCNQGFLSVSSCGPHYSKQHKGHTVKQDLRFTKGFVQTFFEGVGRSFFQVLLPEEAPTSLFQSFRRSHQQPDYSLMDPEDPKQMPPLVKMAGWAPHLAPFLDSRDGPTRLQDLLSAEFPPLLTAIQEYINVNSKKVADAPFAVKRMLNRYPDYRSAHPFNPMLQQNTVANYARAIASLISSALKSSSGDPSGYTIPLNSTMVAAFEPLVALLAASKAAVIPQPLLHRVLASLFLVKYHGPVTEDKWSSPLDSWLAAYMLRPDGTFKTASDATQVIAKLMFVTKLTLFVEATATPSEGQSVRDAVEELARTDLHEDAESPFIGLFDYFRLAARQRHNDPQNSAVGNDLSLTSFSYRGMVLDLYRWRRGLRQLLDLMKQLIDKVCRNQDIPFHIPDTIVDDMTETRRSYTFYDQGPFTSEDLPLLRILLEDDNLPLASADATGALIWNRVAMSSFMDECAAINRVFSMLTMCLPGQAMRSAELVDSRLRNGPRRRCFYYYHGSIYYVVTRGKTEAITGRECFIPFEYPPELAHEVNRYFVILRPVEEVVAAQLYGPKAAENYYNFAFVQWGEKVTGEQYSRYFAERTLEFFRVRLTPRPYRHLVTHLTRTFLHTQHFQLLFPDAAAAAGDDSDDDDNLEHVYAAQRGHSLDVSRNHYGIVDGALQGVPVDRMHSYSEASRNLWKLTGLHPTLLVLAPADLQTAVNKAVYPVHSSIFHPPDNQRKSDDTDLSSTESSSGSSSHPRTLSPGEQFVDPPVVAEYIAVCVRNGLADLTVRFEDIIHNSVAAAVASLLTRLDRLSLAPSAVPPQPATKSVSPGDLLRRLYGPDAAFKSPLQEKSLSLALHTSDSFVAVMPTGAGKSVIFFAPSLLPDKGHTIVVAPNHALLLDLKHRATQLGILCYVWSASNQVPANAPLILIALESVTSPSFAAWFSHNHTFIRRLVFDEAHQVLTERSYRKDFANFPTFAQLPVQKIYLTATLPPVDEPAFRQFTGLLETSRIYREPTTIPHLSYQVIELTDDIVGLKTLAQLVETLSSHYRTQDRGIVFAHSITMVMTIASHLNIVEYHSTLDPAAKDAAFKKWQSGQATWVSASPALAHGVDLPSIRDIIMVGIPFSSTLFHQASGRGGRDGEEARVWIMHVPKPLSQAGNPYDHRQELADALASSGCRREAFTSLMDGPSAKVTCAAVNASPCDNCGSNPFIEEIHRQLVAKN
ncbi:hypothetical protein BDN72DRAFT_905787, partial [Pluteus cervinus]